MSVLVRIGLRSVRRTNETGIGSSRWLYPNAGWESSRRVSCSAPALMMPTPLVRYRPLLDRVEKRSVRQELAEISKNEMSHRLQNECYGFPGLSECRRIDCSLKHYYRR